MEENINIPTALDALTAAAQHHKLLFENETVRVLDTLIPAGEMTNLHTHQWPASLYVISWSDFIRYDASGNILLDSKTLTKTPATATALWSEPLAAHALKNTGNNDLHIISVEIKTRNDH
jgi:hypothetical protein